MTRGVLRNPSRNLTGVGPKGLDKLGNLKIEGF